MTLPALPIFLAVRDRAAILIGEGEAAAAKRRILERAGAHVVGEEGDARIAIVAIEDEASALAAVERLRARGILVNAVDRPALCDFTLPAIVDRAPVLIAIGTGGVSAGLAAALRQRLEAMLSPKLGALAGLLHGSREALRAAYPDASARRHAIARAIAPGGPLDLADPDLDRADWMADAAVPPRTEPVRLRSADPDDLTLREARLLASADRVFHRDDVPPAILDRARADAARIACAALPADPGAGLSVNLGWA